MQPPFEMMNTKELKESNKIGACIVWTENEREQGSETKKIFEAIFRLCALILLPEKHEQWQSFQG